MHIQPLFKECKKLVDGTSEQLFEKGLCLASSTIMTKEDVQRISEVIRKTI